MRILLLWLLLAAALGAAEPEYFVKIELIPPEAEFAVRHSRGPQVPGGPQPNAWLPSGTQFKAGVISGERGIIVAVRAPGYREAEHTFPLAIGRQYWKQADNGWTIPIELTPADLLTQIKHVVRYNKVLTLFLALLPVPPLLLLWRRNEAAKLKEQEAERVRKEAELVKDIYEPDRTGKRIGDYQVLRKLGEGGFAQVYLVQHCDYHDYFALKLMKKEVLDTQSVKRMHREIEIGQQLSHPNLVRIVAFGEFHGAPYLVMDYVEGQPLSSIMDGTPMKREHALKLFRQACEGVSYAHGLGIVHRDLKPHNMVVTPDGTLKVLDFGVAKPVHDHLSLTRTGETMGTPAYMAPEQLLGTTDVQTDIYSLGVILYQLLTGKLPFTGANPMEVMAAHLGSSAVPIRDVVPDTPRALERLCEQMLEKSPQTRIKTVQEILERLDLLS